MATITTWFLLGTIGMTIGTIVLAAGLRLVPANHRRSYWIVVSIPAIAAVAYASMALNVGAVTGGGNTVYLPRYVDWLLTTPLALLYIGLLAGAGRTMLARLGGLQAATILLGLVGAIAGFPWNYLLFAAGSVAFAGVVYLVYWPIQRTATATLSDVGVGQYRTLRNFVIVLWLIYPFIWLVTPAALGLLDLETASLVITYLDVIAKVGFGLFALHNLVLLDVDETALSDAERGDAELSKTESPDAGLSDTGTTAGERVDGNSLAE